MKKNRLLKITACALLALAFAAAPSQASVESALEACRSENGLLPDRPGGDTYSSEVVVRELRLRLLQNDRERFEALYRLTVKHFQSPLMLLYRQLDASLQPVAWEDRTATDLQFCRVLLDAAERWDEPRYRERALKTAGRMLRFNVYRNVLINGASWKERESGIFSIYEPSHRLSLGAVDVKALLQLQSFSSQWEPVAQRCLGILLAGSGAQTLRLAYDVDKRSYVDSQDGSLDALLIMANLLDGGLVPLHSMDRLVERLRAEPACFVEGEQASLAAASLGAYVLAQAGRAAESRQVFLLLEEQFGAGGDLLRAPGQPPSILHNLMYLIVREILEPERGMEAR